MEWFEDYLYIATKNNFWIVNFISGDQKAIDLIQPVSEMPPIAILDLYDSYSVVFAGKSNKVIMINMGSSEGEHVTKVETGWAVTGDNMKVITHGL